MVLLLCLSIQDPDVLVSGWRRSGRVEAPACYERIASAEEFQAFWKRTDFPGGKEPPKVDFEKSMVIALGPGRESDRALMKVVSAEEQEGTFKVIYSLEPTGIDGGPGLMFAAALIRVKRSDLPVTLVAQVKDALGKVVQEKTVKTLKALK